MLFNLHFPDQMPYDLDERVYSHWLLNHSLLEWCVRNKHMHSRDILQQIQSAVEANNLTEAKQMATRIPLGGNGCFNDIWVSPQDSSDTDFAFAQTQFDALLDCWIRAFRT